MRAIKKQLIAFLCLWLATLACQVIPTPPVLTPSPAGREAILTSSVPVNLATSTIASQTPIAPLATPSFLLTPIEPLVEAPFADTQLVTWQPTDREAHWFDLPVDLDKVVNREVLAGLTASQQRYLAQNGFLVLASKDPNFTTIRLDVSLQYGQPYLLTTDAASQALNSSLLALLTALEREELSRRLTQVVSATFEELKLNLVSLEGSSIEKDAKLAAVYLAIGLSLLDSTVEIQLPADLLAMVSAQLKQIDEARGVQQVSMLPGVDVDFTAFQVPAVYRGDSALEAYYRGLTWFSQVGFFLKERPGLPASRAPLIISMALQRAHLDGVSAAQVWADLDETLAFFYGRSLDNDPRLYAAWMNQVYGDKISMLALADEGQWQVFQVLAETLPQDTSYTALAAISREQVAEREWRFFGRRITPDTIALQALPVGREKTLELPHDAPSGLDWMAVIGWTKAEQLLDRYTETASEPYRTQLDRLQAAFQSQGLQQWQSTVFNIGIFSFLPGDLSDPEMIPPFMQNQAWSQKELNTALGNWTGLRQQRLPNTLPEVQVQNNDLPVSQPAPGYVEPNPDIFYRLSYLANVVVDGLTQKNMTGIFAANRDAGSLAFRLQALRDLADRLSRLGDIAAKEIRGVALDQADFALIQAPLGFAETTEMDLARAREMTLLENTISASMIATPFEARDQLFQMGTGWLDRLYMLVELEGEILVAQGGVYSYYEFTRNEDEILNPISWLWVLTHAFPERPVWSTLYHLPEGVPYSVLAFRRGDVYKVTPQGANVSVRIEPSRVAQTIRRLKPNDTIQVMDGPVRVDGITWWKVVVTSEESEPVEGWIIQNQDWFERVW